MPTFILVFCFLGADKTWEVVWKINKNQFNHLHVAIEDYLHNLFWMKNAAVLIILGALGELARPVPVFNLLCAWVQGQKEAGGNCSL